MGEPVTNPEPAMDPSGTSYKDRLRAIVSTYFRFLDDAGFAEAESPYNVVLCGAEIELSFNLHNGELDVYVGPRGAELRIVNLTDLVLYLRHPKVDYGAVQDVSPTGELSDEDIWRSQAADLKQYLGSIVQFAQATGFAERVADLKRRQAERAAEFRSQTGSPDEIDLPSLVGHGLVLIRLRLARTPDFWIYQSIEKQLMFIEDLLKHKAVPTAEDKERLTIGRLAARELEDSDPYLADVLCRIDYAVGKL